MIRSARVLLTVPVLAIPLLLLALTLLADPAKARPEKLHRKAQPIPGRYIVVLNDEAGAPREAAERLHAEYRGRGLPAVYERSLRGFAIELDDADARALSEDPRVAFVEEDSVMTIDLTQAGATWGLDRIDQRALPLNGSYTYNADGTGVNVYVIDSGIRVTHAQFGGRATVGYDAIGDGRNGLDCNGHGTHVAGTIGGATHGVAKKARLYSVRVLDCNGSGATSGVIAGVDWVTSRRTRPAVANMSLGGGTSSALDQAVRNSIASGVTYAIAAGNSSRDACLSSPGRVSEALTVGATQGNDQRASYSNYGTCVDLFAPGSSIVSTWSTSDTATTSLSGTSMASPHVAGAAALYLQANPAATPAQAGAALLGAATTGRLASLGTGSPNRLLYAQASATSAPAPSPSPSPFPTAPCTGCTAYTGSLAGTGASQNQPNGNYYYSAASGMHSGWLQGPVSGNFDLTLYRWTGSQWASVARSTLGAGSLDTVSYAGSAGYYIWAVSSVSGGGSYQFWLKRP